MQNGTTHRWKQRKQTASWLLKSSDEGTSGHCYPMKWRSGLRIVDNTTVAVRLRPQLVNASSPCLVEDTTRDQAVIPTLTMLFLGGSSNPRRQSATREHHTATRCSRTIPCRNLEAYRILTRADEPPTLHCHKVLPCQQSARLCHIVIRSICPV